MSRFNARTVLSSLIFVFLCAVIFTQFLAWNESRATSYGFVFDVADNSLQEQLISEWDLDATTPSESGFFKFAKYPWWPSDNAFLKMDENFSRSDKQNEEYWHVWHDRLNGRLYIEHGRW